MTYQTVNLGTAPTGAGGDTFRSTGAKINENFTNWTHAASRYVGTAAGNLMEVGAFGLGGNSITYTGGSNGFGSFHNGKSAFYFNNTKGVEVNGKLVPNYASYVVSSLNDGGFFAIGGSITDKRIFAVRGLGSDVYPLQLVDLWHTGITTVDANGFIKAASPIVKLYANKIELNDEAAEQPITFEKLGIGHCLIKGSSGFAKDGWWIEIPTDTHGNKICAVEYQTLENGDLEIKTFKKKLNEDGDIVANLDAPIDIPNNANGEPRWIDIRLNEIKKPEVITTLRTEKQPRMVQQIKYSMQPTFMTKLTDLIDDEGKVVMVNGKPFQKKETYLVTDSSGMATLTKQPVINENGEPVIEWVQAVDSQGKPIFDEVPVLDKDGNPIYDEVIYDPE
ncbi:TPA: hypothetical protein NU789_000119 [Acinetobacter baumannii]|uniref:phage tail fiber protein n=1 Tax=Acinetobacter baumannii TaxID=470 RepID=UPI000D01CB6E|nr:hypothetical protein [Acinetobacter baumannii]PRO29259.1 hypothetical protein B9W69_19930 [Acinetobacter baumannii]TLT27074.1 hypothetical protein FD872_07170 [Acinetobacter baumannii]TLT84330.1 hypothetical protein FD881_03620 [Acinetobacter baumannii]HCJ6489218.1 hypothetical protein [Acinetobacter baumannii]HCJ6497511.1 hypothetical protein [Acinetobacter baumannii]